MNTAKNDYLSVGFCCLKGEPQRIARQIGYILHLWPLIIVGQENGISFLEKLSYLILQCGNAHW